MTGRRLRGGRSGLLRRLGTEMRRDLAGLAAGALVIVGSSSSLHLGLLLQQDAQATAAAARQEAGLDVVLCLPGRAGCDEEMVAAAAAQVRSLTESVGGAATTVGAQQVRQRVADGDERLTALLAVAEIPTILSLEIPDDERTAVRQQLVRIPGVDGVQVRNLQQLLLAEQAQTTSLMLLALGLLQAMAAGAALVTLTVASVRRQGERISLLRLLGAPEGLLRRPHLLRATAVGAAAGGMGAWTSMTAAAMFDLADAATTAAGGPLLWAGGGGLLAAVVARLSIPSRRSRTLPL